MIPVTMMMAVSADGRIAKSKDHPADWTSPEDKKLFVKETKKHGVLIMGNNTFKTIGRALPGRLSVVFSSEPGKDMEGVKFVSGDPESVLAGLEAEGYRSAILAGGYEINSLFMEHKLVSELLITFEPAIFGHGLPLFGTDTDIEARLELVSLEKLNANTFTARYKVIYE